MKPLEIRADMDVATICSTCEKALLSVHATELAGVIGHHRDDFDLIWLADGSAVLNTRVWQEMVPPFRHIVVIINLSFENGRVSDIGTIKKTPFRHLISAKSSSAEYRRHEMSANAKNI